MTGTWSYYRAIKLLYEYFSCKRPVFFLQKTTYANEYVSSMFPAKDHICKQPHPYPRVVTSWRGLDDKLMTLYCVMMAMNMDEYFSFKHALETNNQRDGGDMDMTATESKPISSYSITESGMDAIRPYMKMLHTMPDFRVMGYSVGTAYAHEYNGDTIASVMIGGLATVQNGRYPMHTGDPICWYVQYAEEAFFDDYGKRRQPSEAEDILQ